MTERDIFLAALEITNPQARQDYLDTACGNSAVLRASVEALFASHEGAGSFLNRPIVQTPGTTTSSDTNADDPAGSSPVVERTVHFSPGQDPNRNDDDDDSTENEISLGYLLPSKKPGSLGRLGHYEILEVLGKGAFGTVLKAFDEKLHRMVAIKVMSIELASTSPARKRFLREARASAAIRHENVVAIYAVEEQPIPYLVMEYIPGKTLADALVGEGPLELSDSLRLGQQIASGLAAAHSQGLIHRDIKPANILLEEGLQWKVKITDFGLARAADDASVTQSGTIAGTPMYMSPEQAHSNTIDQRSDLFSFGSVLYQMVSGRPPFRADSTLAVLKRVTEDTPRPIQEIIPEVPDWLCTIISKLHQKRADDRYQTAIEVADLLGRCQLELQLAGQVTSVIPNRAMSVNARITQGDNGSTAAVCTKGDEWKKFSPGESRFWRIIVPGFIFIGALPIVSGLLTGNSGWGPSALGIVTLMILFMVFRNRVHQLSLPSASHETASTRPRNRWGMRLVILILPLLVMSPILFGRHFSAAFNNWFWPAIPILPAAKLTTGLSFDGKDDFVAFAPVDWSYPQFTIEAFVTSAPRSDNGVIVSLTSAGKPWELLELYDGHHTGRDQRRSGAQIMGKTPYATATGPLTPDVRQHRALVFDGSHMHYYINGIWQGKRSAEAHEGMMWKLKQLRLASDGDGKKLFEGRIDQVRISKVARYDDNFPPVTSVANDEQTLALYNFDEGQGDVLKDASRHGHNGQIVGAMWINPANVEPETDRSSRRSPNISEPGSAPQKLTGAWGLWPADAPPPAIAPFNAEQAKQHQDVWAEYLNVPVEYTNSIGMKFRLIPPGEFLMGSTEKEITAALPIAGKDSLWQDCIKSEGPQHKAILSQPVYLGVHEVTQSQYQQIMEINPSYFTASGEWAEYVAGMDTSSFPVEGVSWDKARDFCHRLSDKEKLNSAENANHKAIASILDGAYRLPSEAEWEFACRAGTLTQFCNGNTSADLSRAGWFTGSSDKRTHAVGELLSNSFGLYDMHGNVWEWALDAWNPTWYATLTVSPAVNPFNPPGPDSERMSRGGNYSSGAFACRSGSRCSEASSYNATLIGFRVALAVDAVRTALKLIGPAIPKSQGLEWSNTGSASETANPNSQISNAEPDRELAE
jgi:serine/threonine protein kinase/formylglycine-generating enzyme required for sulfatase activity